MNLQEFSSDELFYEPPNVYPESDFEVEGIKVHFSYIVEGMPHFDFHGDISETGYRSYFPLQEHLDQYGVEGLAKEAIKNIRAVYIKEQEQLKRKRKKKEKYTGGKNV